jgi:C-terminal processing protease CtpA/Prc/ABC-type Na+ efflux pump permease subunit
MNHWLKTCWTVARWEFQRYFKLKDQVIGIVSLLVGAVVGYGAIRIAQSAKKVEVAVLGASAQFALPENGKLKIAEGTRTEQEWRDKVQDRSIDGLIVFTQSAESPWEANLTVRQEPAWLEELRPAVQKERMQWQMQAAKLSPETLAQVLAPVDIELVTLASRGVSKVDRLIAYSILGAMLITTWIGLAYMMTGITGEKQLRVTEQIVSAIRPQMWIDGKLIGITGAAIGSLAFLFIPSILCWPLVGWLGWDVSLPDSLNRWEFLPVLLAFYLGGVLFWNCFYAGVASVINDPNTSSRTSLLFLPMLPMIAAGLVVSQPDGAMMRVLSLVPGASSTAMPMRMVLGEVSAVEILLSLIFMLVGIAGLRLLAGRIFAAGIMLYGKEPSWLDIAKWALSRQGKNQSFSAVILMLMLANWAMLTPSHAMAQESLDLEQQRKSFDQVWQTIKDVHWDQELVGEKWDSLREELKPKIEQAKDKESVREILRQMLKSLGQSHCEIIPSETYEAMEEQGNQGGEGVSGLTLRWIDDQLVVTQVRPDSPASKSGVEVGWALHSITRNENVRTADQLILAVRKATEGQIVRFETAMGLAATSALTGAIDETLKAEFLDNTNSSKTVVLQLVQGEGIPAKMGNLPLMDIEFQSRLLDDNIGYIVFNAFFDPGRLMKAFQKAVTQEHAQSQGLVIDMRGNIGGMILMTMGMSGWFVDEQGKLGCMKMKDTPLNVVINPRQPRYKRPVAILIDECSISSAEIYAGGLQDLGVARIFGGRSAGLVLPSNVSRLPNQDGFQYVTADYESASGRVLEGQGVVPDESITLTRAQLKADTDPVLSAAKSWILTQPK